MSASILSGKILAVKLKEEIIKEFGELTAKANKKPCLVAISVGENSSSAIYIKAQNNLASTVGIDYRLLELPPQTTEAQLHAKIQELNSDSSVTAVILQLPLPPQLDAKKIIPFIDPLKDAEGMHPLNLGKLILGKEDIVPCTAGSCFELIRSTNIDLYGKEVVIVGHSEIVGKPLSLLLLNKFCTVSVCHIATSEKGLLRSHVERAEILVVAVGKANLIPGEWVRQGAIVIDVGINKVGDKILGDVDFEGTSLKAGFITPVPGGVGPLTTTILMNNVLKAFKLQNVK